MGADFISLSPKMKYNSGMKEKLILGILFVLGNALGVVPIVGQEGVYRPNQYSAWLNSIQNNPTSHVTSSLLFLVGAVAGILLGSWLYQQGKRYAGLFLSMGAAYNAFWIPVALVLTEFGADVSSFGLGMALFADALFNGFLGLSMLFLGCSLWSDDRKVLGGLGVVIGCVTSLVFAQFWLASAANLLGIIGPCWLVWWLVWSFRKTAGSEKTRK